MATVHSKWDDFLTDAALAVGLANNGYNVYESIVQKHPDSKLGVRCGACAGNFVILVKNLKSHYFTSGSKPSISTTCPHCDTDVDHHSMHDPTFHRR